MFRNGLKVKLFSVKPDKYTLIAWLCLVLLFLFAQAGHCEKSVNPIVFYYQGEQVGKMTPAQFSNLLRSASIYAELTEAEKDSRVKVLIKDAPWNISQSQTMYETQIKIQWLNKDKQVIKQLTMDVELEIPIDHEKYSEIRVIYRDVSEIGFPVAFLLLIVLVAL